MKGFAAALLRDASLGVGTVDEFRGIASIASHLVPRVDFEFTYAPILSIEGGTPKRLRNEPSHSPERSHRARRRLRLVDDEAVSRPEPSGLRFDSDQTDCEEEEERAEQHGHVVRIQRSSRSNYTKEQEEFRAFVPPPGSVVRGNACAGSGKTTMAALLCDVISKRNPEAQIGYFVFGRGNMEEARKSNKFGKNVHIQTTHAFAKKEVAPDSEPVDSHKSSDVMEALGLGQEISNRLGHNFTSKRRKKIMHTVTRYMIKTLNSFCQTSDRHVHEKHVPWDGKKLGSSTRTQWRRLFARDNYGLYVEGARRLWSLMDTGGLAMTHDFYLKKFQLSNKDIGVSRSAEAPDCPLCRTRTTMVQRVGPCAKRFFGCPNFPECAGVAPFAGFDVIILDEAQDLTPCQAAAFWELPRGKQTVIYLLGDDRQRLYRWRGVRDSFRRVPTARDFRLTNSFRFGENIAAAATRILRHASSTAQVRGVASDAGRVIEEVVAVGGSQPLARVVITRSNRGMVRELLRRREILGRWPRWSLVDASCAALVDASKYSAYAAFYTGEQETIEVQGEAFEAWEELVEFVAEEEDGLLLNMLIIIAEHRGDVGFLADAQAALDPQWRVVSADGSPSSDVSPHIELLLSTAHKAKGMEFEAVLLGRDFADYLPVDAADATAQPALKEAAAMGQGAIEESNVLYVAVTRAKSVLQLPSAVWTYLRLLEERFPDLAAPAAKTPPEPIGRRAADEMREWEAARDAFMARWEVFSRAFSRKCVRLGDIPWPAESLLDVRGVGREAAKGFARWLYRRVHEDKFFGRYAVADDCREGVRSALCVWFQRARSAISRGGGDDEIC